MQLVLVTDSTLDTSQQQQQNCCWLPVYVPASERVQIVDMSDWAALSAHACTRLQIPPSVGDIQIEIRLGATACGFVSDDTSLYAVTRQLLRLGHVRLGAEQFVKGVVSSVLVVPRVLPPLDVRTQPMSHEQRTELTKLLLAACYPTTGGQMWGPACDALIASSPVAVHVFLNLREAFAAACTSHQHFLNPVAVLCPFHGGTCIGHGVVRLSYLNNLHNFIMHVRSVHAHNPVACMMVARLQHVLTVDRTAGEAELDELFPWPQGSFGGDTLREVDPSRADLWLPAPPPMVHPLCLMLNELINPRIGAPTLTRRHVFVQALEAMVSNNVGYTVGDWTVELPTLSAFASELYHVGRERTYRLVRGSVLFETGRENDINFPIVWASLAVMDEARVSDLAISNPPGRHTLVQSHLISSVHACIILGSCLCTCTPTNPGCSGAPLAPSLSRGGCAGSVYDSPHR